MAKEEANAPRPYEVADGVWCIPVAFPNPMEYTNAYLIRSDDGALLVDAGWDSDQSWTDLESGFTAAGVRWTDLLGVVITHIHPDHFGLAGRLRERTNAWIAMHQHEADRIPTCSSQVEKLMERMFEWLRVAGSPTSEIESLRNDVPAIVARTARIRPDLILGDGDRVPTTESLTAIHTPGHTRGHLCFMDDVRGLLFTGDHLLPRVTPNISKRPQSGQDPLGSFLRSIAKARNLRASLGLPGHEWVIEDVKTRFDAIQTHHEARLSEVERAVLDGSRTVWDVASGIAWSRPWETLTGLQKRSAIGETHAHLERLARQSRVAREPGSPARWSPVSR